jgi:class 3 adenylate cyclase
VQGQGGRVLQYTGDGLLAAFGADETREDDAERAIRAGLEILHTARELAAGVQARTGVAGFDVRVGLNTGSVLLGGGVDAEGSIRGATVNLAARMEQTAPPGGLRIHRDTYRHVRGVFQVTEAPPSGQGRRTTAAAVGKTGHCTQHPRRRARHRGCTRAWSAQAELGLLRQALDGAVADQRALGHRGRRGRPGQKPAGRIRTRAGPKQACFCSAGPPAAHRCPSTLRDVLSRQLQIAEGKPTRKRATSWCARWHRSKPRVAPVPLGQLIGLDFSPARM